jgi:hypothetical protein
MPKASLGNRERHLRVISESAAYAPNHPPWVKAAIKGEDGKDWDKILERFPFNKGGIGPRICFGGGEWKELP